LTLQLQQWHNVGMASTNRTIRVAEDLWQAAKETATVERVTVTEIIVAALTTFVEGNTK